jgi:pimeloyl-ACP methyl ester carboxylesterase
MGNSVLVIGGGAHKVLALHGWFGSAESWDPLMDVLDTKRFTYAFMDYRGYGGSKHLRGEFSLAEIARDAICAADKMGWSRFSLMGHSMGGAAIQHVLAAAPERVRSLVGITPVPASGVAFDEATWGLFSSAAGSAEARRGILDFSTGNRLSGHWLDRMLAQSLAHSTQEAFAAYLPSWAKTDIAAQIDGMKTPVKVIVGEYDPGLNEGVMRETWMRWYPNARLEVMRNAGHYPMDEAPVALATSIERFLDALPQE